jgi:hypothetical protein
VKRNPIFSTITTVCATILWLSVKTDGRSDDFDEIVRHAQSGERGKAEQLIRAVERKSRFRSLEVTSTHYFARYQPSPAEVDLNLRSLAVLRTGTGTLRTLVTTQHPPARSAKPGRTSE